MACYLKYFLIVLAAHEFFMNQVASEFVNITLLPGAAANGAVCLDGSPPGYFYAEGSDEGQDNWLVFLEGGGWCGSSGGCQMKMERTIYGSTKNRSNANFIEILSGDQATNPDFYNWNRVKIAYCDGSSFLGDVEEVDRINNTYITRRGLRIFDAVMEDLLAKGMEYAHMAILSGGSAGGLGAILHCDGFHARLPLWTKVKCISDAGFFLHAENLTGGDERAKYFRDVVAYHGIAKSLPETCTWTNMDPSLCIFPENIIKDIYTPLFILQAEFDDYQIFGQHSWMNCKKYCCPPSVGIFVVSCYNHSLLDTATKVWAESPVLGTKTIASAVGDWFFDRSEVEEIDTNTVPHYCPK